MIITTTTTAAQFLVGGACVPFFIRYLSGFILFCLIYSDGQLFRFKVDCWQ